jgi:hypothetical protein
MAKTILAFAGFDSTGRAVEAAQSVSGLWFWREYSFNGYAMAWSKWARLTTEVKYVTEGRNEYDDTVFQYPEGKFMEWGFKKLERFEQTPKFRLPE